ncbi:MAG TPA: carboxylesterase family protein [Chloroflexota bacterium]|nr:carboxylesterase family protein [Chloroflexota bacterium]
MPRLFLAGVLMSLVFASSGTLTAAAATYEPRTDVIPLTTGLFGASRDSSQEMRTFRAIPFAAPPVGNLRWQPPQPVTPWEGVRRGDNFSPACTQQIRDFRALFYQSTEGSSEDCLYLNVWTPAQTPAEKKPVMVFFYGGGNTAGSGSAPASSGKGLASKGAVVVSFNYRLGAFGFLAHPELSAESPNGVSGNYALLDQIAVLQWIHDNITAFGGDPNNVTMYGPSAGAVNMTVLLASPLASGLFHKAVLESLSIFPAANPNPTLAIGEKTGLAFASAAGVTSLAALRAMHAPDLLRVPGSFSPYVDGYVFPDQIDQLFASGQVADIPIIVGWNANEGTPYPPFATTAADFLSRAERTYGDRAAEFLALYPVSTDADAQRLAFQPGTDGGFAWQAYTLARAHQAASKSNTFVYHFTRTPPYFADQHYMELDPPSLFGAYHGSEQAYLYNNLDALPRPYTAVDRTLADTASSYLVNFATTGNPNEGPLRGLPSWPTFGGPNGPLMLLGESIAPAAVPNRTAFDFYDSFYAQARGRGLAF